MPEKLRYEVDLSRPMPVSPLQTGPDIRTVVATDLDGLARLMLDAYVGTIDYEGEGLEEAIAEVRTFLADPESRLDRSYLVQDGDDIVSAVLASMSHGRPFISYVMTDRQHKKHGLARLLVTHAISRFAEDGEQKLALYITDGNTPSENLFRSVGAVRAGT